jgi:O-antigen/teichoic acid export membrane protein
MTEEPQPTSAEEDRYRGRFNLGGRSLRQHAARGTLINSGFMIALTSLGFVKGFVLAGFLVRADYGVWGITILTLNIVSRIQGAMISDKYVQQDDEDQEAAFQKAFSLSLLLAGLCILGAAIVLPLFAWIYGEPQIILPGALLALNYLTGPFQMPIWFHYRRMEFVRQRTLQAIEPIVSFIVTVGLAIAGAGFWSLFIGALAGAYCTAFGAMLNRPYAFKWRWERGTLKEYWKYSGPLLVASMAGLVIAQGSMLATDLHLGLAGAGALTLAVTITQYTDRLDGLVTGTLYPALVAVKTKRDVLYESFVKSNRLALMWAVPFGLGLSLFCNDLVNFGIGERWRPALPLLQMFGIIAALGHIGFNWDAYFRARGDTKPMAIAAVVAAVTFCLVGIPLLFAYDERGLAVGVGVQMIAHVACRAYFLRKIFDSFSFLPHAMRAILPTLPSAAVVLLMRTIETGERTPAHAVIEIVVFGLLIVWMTWLMERPLLREVVGYVRRRPVPA